MWRALLWPLLLAQTVAGLRLLARLAATAGGERIVSVERVPGQEGAVSAIVPVLNECGRLGPCLDGLIQQGPELREIVVVDGGSEDGTQDLVAAYRARDSRIRLVDARPIPDDWNGKAWGLEIGAQYADEQASWLLTVDADVRPRPMLVASLLAHAGWTGLGMLSVATEQDLSGTGSALVHPALLATLVYRFGIPGHATHHVSKVQANGQCMLIRRALLSSVGGFGQVRASLCEDVTLARHLAACGHRVGFYESDGLASVRMYESGWETLTTWTRSLPLRDRIVGRRALLALAEVTLAQALPLPLVLLPAMRGAGQRAHWLLVVNLILLVTRLGVLFGTARAYRQAPPAYWLSPLLDIPAVVQLWGSALSRTHRWRGRTLVQGAAV